MSKPLFTNNAQGSLALGITATTTNIQLNAGAGSLFPQPSNIGEYFTLTLVSITDSTYFEIVECIARSGDMLTIVRAQEGTTAKSFNISDSVQLRITAASLNLFAAGGSTGVNATGSSVAEFTATQGQTVFTLPFTYVTGINNLVVFVNGSKQISASNYTESSTTSITFVSGLNAGDLVEVIYNLPLAGGTITASNVTYNEGGTGSVNRTVASKLQESVSVKDFGAVGNGTTDDTVAIQAAITATPSGGRLLIPYGDYLVTSGLVANVSMNIVGEGWSETGGSRLIVSSSMSGTTDVLTMNGATSGAIAGVTLSDFAITPQSGTPARYGINLGNGHGINRATIERFYCGTLGTGSILNNGAFSSTIQNCFLNTGIWFNSGTDNQNVLNNTIAGSGYGIYVNCVAGSNMFNIEGNVIVNKSGGVYIQNSGTMTIANNQFEQQVASDTTEKSIIYASGEARQIESLQIYGNNFNADPALINYSISLLNTQSACIYNNHFAGALPYPKQAIFISSLAYSTRVYGNYIYSTNTGVTADNQNQEYNQIYDSVYYTEGRYSDNGYGTCGLWKLLSFSAFSNVSANASYNPLSIKKTFDNNQVLFKGGVTVTSPATGQSIATIPSGFVPFVNLTTTSASARIPATGAFVPIVLIFNSTTKTIVIEDIPTGLSSIEISLEGCSYFYYYG